VNEKGKENMFHLENSLNRVMSSVLVAGIGFAALLYGASPASAQVLGGAQSFAVLGGSAVAANGSGGHINGDVGIAPAAASAITGIPANATVTPPFVNQGNNAVAIAARAATLTLYNTLAGLGGATVILPGLNGQTHGPGIYSSGDVTLTSGTPLTLSGAGQYIFKVNSITTGVGSSVNLVGVDPCMVFWQVNTIAALNGTTFPGNIVAGTGIHLVTAGSSLVGRALVNAAGDVTMNGGTVGGCSVLGQGVSPFLAATTLSRSGPLPAGTTGTPMTDTKTLSGGLGSAAPTGTIIFTLFSGALCSPANLVFTSSPVTVTGNGSFTSPPFTPTVPGTFHWIATFSGDANNAPTATACGDTTETVIVSSPVIPPGVAAGIPTLSGWGLMTLMVLIGVASIYRLRRL
jgi:Ice-binding-like/IPTL-CTERM motif